MRNLNRLTRIELVFVLILLVVLNIKCGPGEQTAEGFTLTIISGGPVGFDPDEEGLKPSDEFIQLISPVRLENCKELSPLYIPKAELIRIDNNLSCNLYDANKGNFQKNESADSSIYMRYIKNDISLNAAWNVFNTRQSPLNLDSLLSLDDYSIFSYRNENASFLEDPRIKRYNNPDSLRWAIKEVLCRDKARILILINFKRPAPKGRENKHIRHASDPRTHTSPRLPLQDIEISCHSSDRKSFTWEGSDSKYEVIVRDRETSATVYKTNTKKKEIGIATIGNLTDSHPYELLIRYKSNPKQFSIKKFSIGIYHQQKIIEPTCCK